MLQSMIIWDFHFKCMHYIVCFVNSNKIDKYLWWIFLWYTKISIPVFNNDKNIGYYGIDPLKLLFPATKHDELIKMDTNIMFKEAEQIIVQSHGCNVRGVFFIGNLENDQILETFESICKILIHWWFHVRVCISMCRFKCKKG